MKAKNDEFLLLTMAALIIGCAIAMCVPLVNLPAIALNMLEYFSIVVSTETTMIEESFFITAREIWNGLQYINLR